MKTLFTTISLFTFCIISGGGSCHGTGYDHRHCKNERGKCNNSDTSHCNNSIPNSTYFTIRDLEYPTQDYYSNIKELRDKNWIEKYKDQKQNITTEFIPQNFYDSLSVSTLSIVDNNIVYTPEWVNIDYPMGDVPEMTGVCSDVIIRAYRKMGIDLQKEIHEDILSDPSRYPNINHPDNNIDHRRVPNLSIFFSKYGEIIEVTDNPKDYKAGDIVYWKLGGKTNHIGIVTHLKSENGTPLIVHNICCGQNLEDRLFDYDIYKHFRYKK